MWSDTCKSESASIFFCAGCWQLIADSSSSTISGSGGSDLIRLGLRGEETRGRGGYPVKAAWGQSPAFVSGSIGVSWPFFLFLFYNPRFASHLWSLKDLPVLLFWPSFARTFPPLLPAPAVCNVSQAWARHLPGRYAISFCHSLSTRMYTLKIELCSCTYFRQCHFQVLHGFSQGWLLLRAPVDFSWSLCIVLDKWSSKPFEGTKKEEWKNDVKKVGQVGTLRGFFHVSSWNASMRFSGIESTNRQVVEKLAAIASVQTKSERVHRTQVPWKPMKT